MKGTVIEMSVGRRSKSMTYKRRFMHESVHTLHLKESLTELELLLEFSRSPLISYSCRHCSSFEK